MEGIDSMILTRTPNKGKCKKLLTLQNRGWIAKLECANLKIPIGEGVGFSLLICPPHCSIYEFLVGFCHLAQSSGPQRYVHTNDCYNQPGYMPSEGERYATSNSRFCSIFKLQVGYPITLIRNAP